jgi:antitoxin StbD
MEQVLAARSVSITELKRSPSAVLEQAGSDPVAVLNHNRPAAYLLSPAVYEAMLLRQAIHAGIHSGPAIAADEVFAQLDARYAEPAASKPLGKRKA